MESILIDSEWLAAELPDGFERIPHKELETMMGFSYNLMWGSRDTQRHMILCVSWKDSNKVLTKLVREKSYIKQVHNTYKLRFRKLGYRRDEFFACTIDGADHEAQGLRFAYTIEGIPHRGETITFKRGIRCYTLQYLTRTETADANRPTYEAILDSLKVN